MAPLTLPLSDPAATLEIVGGKGMSLARLTRAGLPVPNGFYLTTEAYTRFVTANRLQAQILQALRPADPADPATLEAASRLIGGLFQSAEMPAQIAAALAEAAARLGDVPVAVRSSATAEDLPGASFAGQQETYLNIRGTAAIQAAVKRCWASLWTGRAIGYRLKNGIDQARVALAVVIQELVPAEAAGVLFTASPVSGRRQEALINAAWGLGEAVVSGAVTPDTYTVEKSTCQILRRQAARKKVMTVRTASGTLDQAVPPSLQMKPVLTRKQIAHLTRLGSQIEALYGIPMDIEWAVAQGKFSILQARPITSLPEPPLEWVKPYPRALMARQSFAEFVPNPVSPLFATLAVPIASQASLSLFSDYLGDMGPNAMFFTVVNHYIYLGSEISWKMMKTILAVLARGEVQKMFRTIQTRWMAAEEKYRRTIARWDETTPAALTSDQLLQAAREIFKAAAEYYTAAQSGPIPGALSAELAFTRFYNPLIKRRDDPTAPEFLVGFDSLPLRAEKSLFDLAQWVKLQPGLAEALASLPTDEIWAALQAGVGPEAAGAGWAEFSARLQEYQDQFGFAVYDLDFAKPTAADDPRPQLDALRAYLAGKGSDPHARQRDTEEKRARATAQISGRLDPLRRKWFLKLLQTAQDWVPKREDCISRLGLGYPLLRRLFAELGRRMAAGGAIARPEDIYWLEAGEVEDLAAALDRGSPLPGAAWQVGQRKAELDRVRDARVPLSLPEKTWYSFMLPREKMKGNRLMGIGASRGRVTARACVLRDPQDFGQMQPGDVIVAMTTTPAWTPLFAMASAVVTDIGGPLSHSSIVAREFGIPAVLATGSATHRIHTGQIITVDGSQGAVWIGEAKPAR